MAQSFASKPCDFCQHVTQNGMWIYLCWLVMAGYDLLCKVKLRTMFANAGRLCMYANMYVTSDMEQQPITANCADFLPACNK